MERVEVRLIDLPTSIRGFTAYTEDDTGEPVFTIILNARLDLCAQMRTYKHEVQHINNADFDSMIPADRIEAVRHATL